MKFKLLFFFSIVVITQFYSCKSDKQTQLPPLLIPDEMKAYTLFKPGTYWVYQDSISGAIDCVYVTSSDDYQFEHEYDDGNRTYEQFDMTTNSSFEACTFDYQQNSTFARNCDESENRSCFFTWVSKSKPGNFIGTRFDFLYKIETNLWAYQYWTSDDTITINNFYDSVSFEGKNYSNVVEILIRKDRLEKYCDTKYFHCKNMGVVRKENLDSLKIWNLINCNIVQ